ncbi:uncharacterized protein LOC110983982 [Acanthaster planci]|uniref:Uncharacterized protein LOC110983982 n=1 Tax=Acanthaster planci TaxID=133434 RepID=A0A8B7Z389_ACAPL|nr:uncharacterized protein LOC110983982 [Acanthaster planci]
MDFKIAAALNLSPELVWFSRQSYEEELSSLSSEGLSVYGGYFPEMPHDLGSDGTKSPGRDDSFEADSIAGDDFTHALFAQEQLMLNQDSSFEFGNSKPASDLIDSLSVPVPTAGTEPLASSPATSQDQGLSTQLEIYYSPSPSASSSRSSSPPQPELMVATSPVQIDRLLASQAREVPVTLSRLQGSRNSHPVAVAAWQREILRDSVSRHSNFPSRAQLRELAQMTHLPVSTVMWWFAEQRRINFHQAKYGFHFTEPASHRVRAGHTLKITNHSYCTRH